MKKELKFIKEVQKSIINQIWIENLSYCFCGSWFRYEKCCKTNKVEDSWFMDAKFKQFLGENEDIIIRKNGVEKEKIKPWLIKWLYQQLESYWRLKTCIVPCCKNDTIFSHLIPKNFIKSLQKQWYKFKIKWTNNKLWADSFAIKLWCQVHDWRLFKETDSVWDIAALVDIFDEENKDPNRAGHLWEFFLKTLSFKVKTLILDQMYWYLWMLLSTSQSKEFKGKILKRFLDNYGRYNRILTYFDSLFFVDHWKRDICIPYLDGKSGKVMDIIDQWEVFYQTNIKLIWDIPLFINSIVKNWNWIYYIWTTKIHILDKKWKEKLEKIYEDIWYYKNRKDCQWALDHFNNLLKNENIYYLNMDKGFFWNTYIYWNNTTE